MKSKHVLASLTMLALAACSSGGDSGTPPVNDPPTITFTVAAIAVPKGVATDLTVTASDPDGDPLTIIWDITRGSLTAQNNQQTVMRWATPADAGVDTVSISVTDGTHTRSITAEIKAGTVITVGPPPATFTRVNSPYILRPSTVDPKVTMPANLTRVIEPGVELLIDTEEAYINVLGTLEAHGTEDEPIVIRPNNRNFKCTTDRGWWEGIRASSDDAVSSDGFVDFEHVEIRDARWSIRLRDNASALLRDCKVLCSGDAGVLIEGNGSLRALDTRISDGSGDGVSIGGPAIVSLPDSVRIEGCTIVFNGNAGIRMDLQDLFQVVPITVELNRIEFNETHGISLARAVFPGIHYNAFLGNGDNSVSNLFLQGGYPGGAADADTLDATCNFWGSAATSQSTVDASIRDKLDTSGVGTRVDSCPWLNGSPITGSPACTCPVP